MPVRNRIFISAYACEPNLGSEIGVGWNWILQISKSFDVWVLTRKSNKASIESWIKNNRRYKNITFIYFDLPYLLRFWKKKKRGVRVYYNLWQLFSNNIVKRQMIENNIKIFHHLTYGNALWSVSSYGAKQFFIWGPIGGLETISREYSSHYFFHGRALEFARRFIVRLIPLNIFFRKRCSNADLILCKTEITKSIIDKYKKATSMLFTDVAVDESIEEVAFSLSQLDNQSTNVRYFTAGNLDSWRGFDILIEAFSAAYKMKKNINLKIVGDGKDKHRIKKLITKHQMSDQIELIGEVPHENYKKLIIQSDIVINPCLKEGAVTVSFDSMKFGKPLICIDTSGYTRYFSNEYALKIPLLNNRNDLILKLSDAILKLANSDKRKLMSKQCLNAASRFTWDKRGREIIHAIENSYKN